MKNGLKNYLYFTKVERNGLLFLLLLLVMFLLSPWVYSHFLPQEVTDFSDYKKNIAKLDAPTIPAQKVAATASSAVISKTKQKAAPKIKEKERFPFDPNTATEEEFRQLGFPSFLAKRILKYRAAKGVFKEAKDLKKIYGLEESLYAKLEPYIKITVEIKKEDVKPVAKTDNKKDFDVTKSFPKKESVSILVNSATAAEWKQLYGIGPVLSERIVKFRDKLGGFSQLDQIGEIYGLPDSTFQQIKPSLTLNNIELVKLDINTVSIETLAAHPYLKWKQAKILVNYRTQHGPYQGKADLQKLHGLPPEVIEKLLPYIEFKLN